MNILPHPPTQITIDISLELQHKIHTETWQTHGSLILSPKYKCENLLEISNKLSEPIRLEKGTCLDVAM